MLERIFRDDSGQLHGVSRYDEWPTPIPVSERLPEIGDEVLVFSGDEWFMAYHEGDNCYEELDERFPVTHWLPLPPRPEGG